MAGQNRRDLTGQKFGRLTTIRCVGRDKWKHAVWECVCICGTVLQVVGSHLRQGKTKSCGCLCVDLAHTRTTHGCARKGQPTAEYRAYNDAKNRCENPRHPKFADYGGRGIRFLFHSFQQFFAEIGPRPKGLTLDRTDNNGHYAPGNVRWATRSEQNRNQRRWQQPAYGSPQPVLCEATL